MSNEIVPLDEIDGEALVHDEKLARALGYAHPRQFRTTIKRHRDELEAYGPLLRRTETQLRTNGATHYVDAYYLNEEQALLLCMFSGAERAKEIRRQVITVYQAKRKGKLVPAMPNVDLAEAARAWALEHERKTMDYAAALRLAADKHEERQKLAPGDVTS